jgi:hypothetical protein
MKTRNAALKLLALACGLVASSSVLAGPANKVYLPIVEKGETEFEFRGGYRDYSGDPNEYATVFDVGYGVTSRWKTELSVEYSGQPGQGSSFEAMEWENVIVFTEQGEHWADVGLLVEYEHTFADGPDELKVGPIFMKEIGPTVAALNLIFESQVGSGASNDIDVGYAWQVKWRGKEALEWGLQGFGGAGQLDNLGTGDDHSIGPALFGVKRLASGNKLAYDAAILAGLNDAAPDLAVRFELEYEMY